VLAHSIVVEGMKNLAAGANPMLLKRGIDRAVETVVDELKKISISVEGRQDIGHVAGIAAKTFLQGQVTSAPEIRFRSFKDKRDKYGRILLDLIVVYEDGATFSLNERMVETGNAVKATY